MRVRTLTMAAALALAGCEQGFGGFNEGGSSNDPELFGDDTGEDEGDDEGNPDAPEILSVGLGFEDYPNIGVVLEVVVEVSDAQDDLMNGALIVTLTPASTGETSEVIAGINNTDARLEGSDVITVIRNVDQGDSYDITVQVVDAANNESEVERASI